MPHPPLDPTLAAAVGAVVAEARARSGLSTYALERRAGVRASTVPRIERGLQLPTLPVLLRLAAALGIDLGALEPCKPKQDGGE
jgi:transcriptional regulator with XRE-family HTH domain